jgi:hypothetical protein
MKYSILALFVLVFISCNNTNKEQKKEESSSENTEITTNTAENQQDQSFFGEEFDYTKSDMINNVYEKYQNMKPGDTVVTTFGSTVNSVCVKKGCWMRLKLTEEEESLVTFKDYGFFVPKDIDGQEAVVHGKLFVKETSVEDLKHFAKDAGKSEEEIAAITEPKLVYAFEADGVYLK